MKIKILSFLGLLTLSSHLNAALQNPFDVDSDSDGSFEEIVLPPAQENQIPIQHHYLERALERVIANDTLTYVQKTDLASALFNPDNARMFLETIRRTRPGAEPDMEIVSSNRIAKIKTPYILPSMFDNFLVKDRDGSTIPEAVTILKALRFFTAPTEEIPLENRGPKLLYIHGKPGTGKTLAAKIVMGELEKRSHKVKFLDPDAILHETSDVYSGFHTLIVIDGLDNYGFRDILETKLRHLIDSGFKSSSLRIVITSIRPLGDLKRLVTQWYLDREWKNTVRVKNADQLESNLDLMMLRAGAPKGLNFSDLPVRRL